MQLLDHSTYESLRAGATVLEADKHGDKVLRLADGNFLKLFRRKRLITSAALYPYAQRFADNALTLQRLGIPCPDVLGVYRIPSINRNAVHYHPLPGKTLRQVIADNRAAPNLPSQLGALIAKLHDLGVYFRSLHLGNIVQTPENQLGLIDLADMRAQHRALSRALRKRNFVHMLRYQHDRSWLLKDNAAGLRESYLKASPTAWDETELRQIFREI